MTIKKTIQEMFKTPEASFTAAQLSEQLGASRPYVSSVLNDMVATGELQSERISKNVIYHLPSQLTIFDATLNTVNLSEGEVWNEFKNNPTLKNNTTGNTRSVLQFAFTEMLNNAIDHSKSPEVYIRVTVDNDKVFFLIRDFGIGVFRNIMQNKHFPDEVTSIQELMKGKLTTAIRAHSGEGIFWTSKCAEHFELISYDYELSVDNRLHDYAIRKLPDSDDLVGTEVRFRMPVNTKVSLSELFKSYAATSEPGDLSVGTTTVHLKLYDTSDLWISRSQAKRVLAGLDKYRKIIFDFSGVEVVGQAFCDEIFRVYRQNHPDIELRPVHMDETVGIMVNRALKDNIVA